MAYLMIAPVMLGVVLFRAVPVVASVALSFCETDLMAWAWAGADNYRAIITDADRLSAISNTLLYVLISTPLSVVLSLRIALSLRWAREPERHAVRLLIYIPALTSGVVMAAIWRYLFHYDGMVNLFLGRIGAERVTFFSTAMTSIIPISLINVVGGVGIGTILFLAAIKGVPEECYDAARVEGAGRRALHRLVTLPMIRETIALVTAFRAIATVQLFDLVYALAPMRYAQTVGYAMFREAFMFGKFGIGSSYAVILFVMSAAVAIGYRRFAR